MALVKSNTHHRKPASGPSYVTLSELLYTSPLGDTVYQEPLQVEQQHEEEQEEQIAVREMQCRTENWTASWKSALHSLTDASVSMQGYLCKMTASKWNSRGTLDKIQRRWFVLRGRFMTYLKTNAHPSPKGDKCVDLQGFRVNPVLHAKSKFAFELISPPQPVHKRNQSSSDSARRLPMRERTKFVLIPDLDVAPQMQREIRDKWVKSLRLATKGSFLWDVLLRLHLPAHGHGHGHGHGRNKSKGDVGMGMGSVMHSSPSSNPAEASNSPSHSAISLGSHSHSLRSHAAMPGHGHGHSHHGQHGHGHGGKRRVGGNTQDYRDTHSGRGQRDGVAVSTGHSYLARAGSKHEKY